MNRYRIFVFVAATLSAALWAYACGDGTTEPPPPPPDPPRPTTVTVSPATAQLAALGAMVQLSAEVRDQNGQAMAGAAVSWASSAAAVATVSSTGLVTAVGNGTASITATAGSASGTAAVAVAQEVSAVAVTPAAETLVAGDTLRLAAEATDANGHPVAEAEVSWASSDTLVAVVDDAGLATALDVGQAEVTATASGITGRAAVTVVAPVPTTIGVAPDTLPLTALGQTAQLTAEVRDQAGRVMEGEPVSWSSADTTVAAVDSAGLVTAAGSGTTTIIAAAGEATGSALLKVMQSADSVIVSPPADTIASGDTLRLVAEAFDENGHAVEGAEFSWSSNNVSVATVDASGLVRGVAEGTATITATAGDALGTSEITVENPDRAALVALYEATDGPNWVNSDNWLTDARLGDWYGVDTDRFGRVVRIDLAGRWDSEAQEYVRHGLKGPIPAALGRLANLENLSLGNNELTGPIPTELASLANLESLSLGNNELTGPIPKELGSLANLRSVYLSGNALTGSIPAELGNLVNLEWLYLTWNKLEGPIPQGFLQLDKLQFFYIGRNEGLCVPGTSAFVAWLEGIEHRDESGNLCNESDWTVLESLFERAGGSGWTNADGWVSGPALDKWHGVHADSLGRVTALDVSRNGLSGRLPATLGALAQMTELRIGGNTALSGPLPLSLAALSLRALHYDGTSVCAPSQVGFRAWLNAIPSHEGTGASCRAAVGTRDPGGRVRNASRTRLDRQRQLADGSAAAGLVWSGGGRAGTCDRPVTDLQPYLGMDPP